MPPVLCLYCCTVCIHIPLLGSLRNKSFKFQVSRISILEWNQLYIFVVARKQYNHIAVVWTKPQTEQDTS